MTDQRPEQIYCLRCKSRNVYIGDIKTVRCQDCKNVDEYRAESIITDADRLRYQKYVSWIPPF